MAIRTNIYKVGWSSRQCASRESTPDSWRRWRWRVVTSSWAGACKTCKSQVPIHHNPKLLSCSALVCRNQEPMLAGMMADECLGKPSACNETLIETDMDKSVNACAICVTSALLSKRHNSQGTKRTNPSSSLAGHIFANTKKHHVKNTCDTAMPPESNETHHQEGFNAIGGPHHTTWAQAPQMA